MYFSEIRTHSHTGGRPVIQQRQKPSRHSNEFSCVCMILCVMCVYARLPANNNNIIRDGAVTCPETNW